jgi:hypothetical protein
LSWERELERLARDRENAAEASLSTMVLDDPGTLKRQLRFYLAEQADRGRLKRTYDGPRLVNQSGATELICDEVEFCSDSALDFKIRLVQEQTGWFVKQFKFHVRLVGRAIRMVRIHLNPSVGHEPLRIPRCHLHIGDSSAHIPFPIMSPQLMVHLICEHIEPDMGI